MLVPPRPQDEDDRLRALRRHGFDDVEAPAGLDDLLQLTARVCGAPIALVSIVDADQQWALASHGIEWPDTPRGASLCAWALLDRHPLVVDDTRSDPRFACLPQVTGSPGIQSYSSAPLLSRDGHVLGTLCVMARTPGAFTSEHAVHLRVLAAQVMAQLDLQRHHDALAVMHRLAAIIETEPECVKVVSPVGALMEMNPAGLAMLEASSLEDARSQPLTRYLLPEYRDAFSQAHARVLAGHHASLTFELRGLRGGHKWLEMHAAPLRGPDGTVQALLSVTRDITERRRAEDRVRQLNRVFAMHSGINQSIVRTGDVTTLLNRACRTAVERGGFLMAWIGVADDAGALAVRAHAGADPSTLAIIRQLIEGAPPGGCTFTHHALTRGEPAVCQDVAGDPDAALWRTEALDRGYRSMASLPLARDGRTFATFNLYAPVPHFFNDDEIRTLKELAADLSFAVESYEHEAERVKADEERRAAEERFRQLAENIRDVFWILDPATRQMLYVSPAFESIWQRPCETPEQCRRHWIEALHPEDEARVQAAMRGPLLEGLYVETYRIVRPDGSVRWIRDRAFPIRDETGEIHRIVGTAEDVTRTLELEAQFLQAQKMETVGRLAGGIAHDFNNLLTVIRGLAELGLSGSQATGSLRSDLEQIREAGDRASALTDQLLAVSQGQVLNPRIVDLNDIVTGMRDILTRAIDEDIQLVVRLGPGLGLVRVDPGQIEQVILNLSVNARDAMPRGGTLTIETRDLPPDGPDQAAGAGGRVLLLVTDTGVGMDEETQQKIFEPFFTTKGVGQGTGLGLSTVHGIVTQSGGQVDVDSTPGRGSTFTVVLPIETQALTTVGLAPREPATSLQGSETVLVVEDEEAVRLLTRRVLETSGYAVLEAANGDEALSVAAELGGAIHLVLSDVVMPGLNAVEMTTRLLAARPAMKIVYMSGYAEDAIKRQGAMQAHSTLLVKPFRPADLLRIVRSTLDA